MRRFLSLFLSLCLILSGSVAFAAESSQPNRLGGYVSIFDWVTAQDGGGGTSGGGVSRWDSKDDYDKYKNKLQTDYSTTLFSKDGYMIPILFGSNASTGRLTSRSSFRNFTLSPNGKNATFNSDYYTENRWWGLFQPENDLGLYLYTNIYSISKELPVSYVSIVRPSTRETFSASASGISFNFQFSDFVCWSSSFLRDSDISLDDFLLKGKEFLYDGSKRDPIWLEFRAYVDILSKGEPGATINATIPSGLQCYLHVRPVTAVQTEDKDKPSDFKGTLVDDKAYYDNAQIVDDTISKFTDLPTGTTYNITNWTYDYGDRTYNLTLEDGSKAVVVYGDDGITVDKGAITTEYKYWLPDNSGGSSSSSSGGNSSSSTPGGDNGGGSWSVIGEMLGKVFKGIADFLGAILGAVFGALTALLGVIVDGIGGLVKSLLSIFQQLPPLFAGFTAFLAAIFPYLPKEFTSLIILGMAAVIAAGLIRVLIKR